MTEMGVGLLEDRFFGALVGGAIASLGPKAWASRGKVLLTTKTPRTYDWSAEYSAMLCLLKAQLKSVSAQALYDGLVMSGRGEGLDDDTVSTCLPLGQDLQRHVHNTGTLTRALALALVHHNNFENMLIQSHQSSLETHNCLFCADLCKLYSSILDGALHGRPKKEVLNPVYYSNLQLSVELWTALTVSGEGEGEGEEDESLCPLPITCLKYVIGIFQGTNNFKEGLQMAFDSYEEPGGPAVSIMYGQLAGAYYGLSDISEAEVALLKSGNILLDLGAECLKAVS